jgi:outer membrane protein with beta-barrel domain
MQKTAGLLTTAMLCLLLGVGSASAAPEAGMSELQAAGGFFHSQGSDSGSLNAELSYGYYLTRGWQVGLRQALNYDFIDDHRDFWVATTVPFLNYNFRVTDIIVPYLGGFIGLVWNDRDTTGTIGPQGGIKFFVHDTAFINLGYRYEFFFNRIKAIEDNASRGNHVFNIGVGLTWGGASTKP